MKKLFALLSILVIIVFLGCVQNEAPKHQFTGKNCGTNITCYQQSLQKCEKANVSLTQNMNGMSITVYSDIQGGSVDSCKIYQQIKNIQIPENTSAMEKMAMSVLNGADAICIGPVNKLKTGSFDEFQKNFNCSGTLYELIKVSTQQTEN